MVGPTSIGGIFRVHYLMARDLGKAIVWDLRQRCNSGLTLQEIEPTASKRRKRLAKVAGLRQRFRRAAALRRVPRRPRVLETTTSLRRGLTRACRLKPPRLKCLPPDQPLPNVLLSEAPVPRLKPVAQTVSGRWVVKLARQMDEVRNTTPHS